MSLGETLSRRSACATLGLQMHVSVSSFMGVPGNAHSGPHAGSASTLSTEPSPQPPAQLAFACLCSHTIWFLGANFWNKGWGLLSAKLGR